MSGLDISVLRTLTRGDALGLCTQVAAHLQAAVGGTAAIWLVDYAQRSLTRTGHPDEGRPSRTPVDGSWLGRCFAAQQQLVETDQGQLHLAVPLSTRGHRLGVVELSFPEGSHVPVQDLSLMCDLLAQALESLPTVVLPVESARRRERMTVAAELQWSLLPGAGYADGAVSVAGMLEPAYSVSGDAFDWARREGSLQVAVLQGSGRGVPAALVASLALSALRNARQSGLSLADQAALADQAVYAHHGGQQHISALLLEIDLERGRVLVVDAGSPALYRVRRAQVDRIELDAQLPLGMFEESHYRPQAIDVRPGDRLVILSDGLSGNTTAEGRTFTDVHLDSLLRGGGLLLPAELARQAISRLTIDDRGLESDAVFVCIDLLAAP